MAKQKTAGLKPRRTLQGFVLAGLFGWIASFPVAAEETINIGVQQAMMPIFIAKASGGLGKIESKYGVRFVFHTYAYGGPENKALASGELQMASAGMGPAISAASRLPVKLLAITILEQTVLLVPVDSPIKTVAVQPPA